MTEYYVYIMCNESRTLYIGVTNDIERRVYEHKMKFVPGFTSHYDINRLVFFESTDDVTVAIQWEKEIKGWVRRKKTALIHTTNPEWKDLSEDWYGKSVILKESFHRRTTEESRGGAVKYPPLRPEILPLLRKGQDDKVKVEKKS